MSPRPYTRSVESPGSNRKNKMCKYIKNGEYQKLADLVNTDICTLSLILSIESGEDEFTEKIVSEICEVDRKFVFRYIEDDIYKNGKISYLKYLAPFFDDASSYIEDLLEIACRCENSHFVKEILDNFIVEVSSSFCISCEIGNVDIAKLLINYHKIKNMSDNHDPDYELKEYKVWIGYNNFKSLSVARENGNEKIVKLIMEHKDFQKDLKRLNKF